MNEAKRERARVRKPAPAKGTRTVTHEYSCVLDDDYLPIGDCIGFPVLLPAGLPHTTPVTVTYTYVVPPKGKR